MKGEFDAYFETRIVCSVIFTLFYSTSSFPLHWAVNDSY